MGSRANSTGRRKRFALVAAAVGGAMALLTSCAPYGATPTKGWRAEGVGRTVVVANGRAYVGGSFSQVSSYNGSSTVARGNLAAFDLKTGNLVSTFRADTNGRVRALAVSGSTLYIGGEFTTVNGVARTRLAAV